MSTPSYDFFRNSFSGNPNSYFYLKKPCPPNVTACDFRGISHVGRDTPASGLHQPVLIKKDLFFFRNLLCGKKIFYPRRENFYPTGGWVFDFQGSICEAKEISGSAIEILTKKIIESLFFTRPFYILETLFYGAGNRLVPGMDFFSVPQGFFY